MYTKTIFIFLFCSIFFIETKAQVEKRVQGTIIDGNTNIPIEGVYLKLSNNGSNAITDKLGHFLMLLINNTSSNDSIIINALGYKTIKLPISILNNEPIKLYEENVILTDVIVQSFFNWHNFIKKIKLNYSTSPFESEFHKNITIKQNYNSIKEFKFDGYAHYEGITKKGLFNINKGKSLEYGVFFTKFSDTNSFINFDGSESPQLFTAFQKGFFVWLFIMTDHKYQNAKCKIIDVTTLGGDSVYVIKYIPNYFETIESIKKKNRYLTNGEIRKIYYTALDKTIYVRKNDMEIIQIDYNQRNEISNVDTVKNINKILEISGSVKFEYFNNTPHPIFLNEKYKYIDKYGNIIERDDKIYYSNIKNIRLSEAELIKKYQLLKIYKNYPLRQFNFLNDERIGPFSYTPIIKLN